ncbi:MAG: heavy-metal-associated domain-containing protein [Rhodospirillales bacterium]|nr:heavy-metal-associated domain-containing protein [Rhodospirillales bacterium]
MNETNIVKRKIKVAGLDDCSRDVGEWLRSVDGVVDAEASPDTGRVTVSYDLRQCTLPQVAERLEAIGLRPSNHVLDRLRRGWASFTEDNIRSSLGHQGHCCSKPPAGR